MPLPCTTADLTDADIIVAVKEVEHRPLLAERHAGWEDQAVYWHVHDVDEAHPDDALAQLKRHVMHLVQELNVEARASA